MYQEWLEPEKLNLRNLNERVPWLRHLKAYEFAKLYAPQKKVLEIGCGAGYGSKILSEVAETLIGLDVDEKAQLSMYKKKALKMCNFY